MSDWATGKLSHETEVWFIRHGQTDWNVVHRLQGHKDIDLNDNGRNQAAQVASYVKQLNDQVDFHAVYSSGLKRAHNTAVKIAEQINMNIQIDDRFRERFFGEFEGLTRGEISADETLKKEFLSMKSNPSTSFRGAESMELFSERVGRALEDIVSEHAGKRVLVISHGGVIYNVLHMFKEKSVEWSNTRVPNVSISIMRHSSDEDISPWTAHQVALTEHL